MRLLRKKKTCAFSAMFTVFIPWLKGSVYAAALYAYSTAYVKWHDACSRLPTICNVHLEKPEESTAINVGGLVLHFRPPTCTKAPWTKNVPVQGLAKSRHAVSFFKRVMDGFGFSIQATGLDMCIVFTQQYGCITTIPVRILRWRELVCSIH